MDFFKHVYIPESLKVSPSCLSNKGSVVINPGYSFLADLKWEISVRYESNFLVVLQQFLRFTRTFKKIIYPKEALGD